MEANKRRLVIISLCALAAAIILGVVLFFVFRGATGEQNPPPESTDPEQTQTMPGNSDDVQPTPEKDRPQHDLSNPVYREPYVPYDMVDGMYRLVGSEAYVNGEGKACYSTKTNELIYWAFGGSGLFRSSVDFEGDDKALHSILTAIGNGSIFNVESGKITAIYIFPGTTEDTKKDLSALPEGAVKDVDVVIAINPSTSAEAGMATATNTGLLLPNYFTSFKVFLDGDYVLENSERTPTFLTEDSNGLIVISTGAGEGASARIFADFGDKGYRAFKITLLRDGTIELIYETTVESASQGGGQGGGMTGAPVPDGVYTWSNGRLRCADTGVILMKNETLGWMIINGENKNLVEEQTVITVLETLSESDALEIVDGKAARIIKDGSVGSGGSGGSGGGSGMTGAPVPDGVYTWSNGRLRCADTGVILMKNETLGWMIINGENRNLIDDQSVIDGLEALAETDAVEMKDGKIAEIIENGSAGSDGGSGGSGDDEGVVIPDGEYTLRGSIFTGDNGYRLVYVNTDKLTGWILQEFTGTYDEAGKAVYERKGTVTDQSVIDVLEEAKAAGKGIKVDADGNVTVGDSSSGGNGGGGNNNQQQQQQQQPQQQTIVPPDGTYTKTKTQTGGIRLNHDSNGKSISFTSTGKWIYDPQGADQKVINDPDIIAAFEKMDFGDKIVIKNGKVIEIIKDSSGGDQDSDANTLAIPEGTWEVKSTEGSVTLGLAGSSAAVGPINTLFKLRQALAAPIAVYADDEPEYYLQGIGDIAAYSLRFLENGWQLYENGEIQGTVNAAGEAGAFLNNVSADGWNRGTYTYDNTKSVFTPVDQSSGKEIVNGVYTVCETTNGNPKFQYLSNGVIAMRYARNTSTGTSSWSVKFAGDATYAPITSSNAANWEAVLDALEARFGTSLSGQVGNRYYFDGESFKKPGVSTDVSKLIGKYTVVQDGTGSQIVHEYDGGEVTITNKSGAYTVAGGYKDERDDDLIDALKAFLNRLGLTWGNLVERYGNWAYYDGFRFGYDNFDTDDPGIVEDGVYQLVTDGVDAVTGATKADAKAKATAKNKEGTVTLVMSNEDYWYILNTNDSYDYISDKDVQAALCDLYANKVDEVVIWKNTTFRIADGTYTIRASTLLTGTTTGLYYNINSGRVQYRQQENDELKDTYLNPETVTGLRLSAHCKAGYTVKFENNVITEVNGTTVDGTLPPGCDCSEFCNCGDGLNCGSNCHCADCPGNEGDATLALLEDTYVYADGVFTREDNLKLRKDGSDWKVIMGETTKAVEAAAQEILDKKNGFTDFQNGKSYVLNGDGWTEAPVERVIPDGRYTMQTPTSTNFVIHLKGNGTVSNYSIRKTKSGTWALWTGQESTTIGDATLVAALEQAVKDGLAIGDTLIFVNDTFTVEKGSGSVDPPASEAQEVPAGTYTVDEKGNSSQSYRYLLNGNYALRYVRNSGWSVSFSGGNSNDYALINADNVTNWEALLDALDKTFGTTGNKGLTTNDVGTEYDFDGTKFTLKVTTDPEPDTDCKCGNENCGCEGNCDCTTGCQCENCTPGGNTDPEPTTNIPAGDWTVTKPAQGNNRFLTGSGTAEGYTLKYAKDEATGKYYWTLYRNDVIQTTITDTSITAFLTEVKGCEYPDGTVFSFDGEQFTKVSEPEAPECNCHEDCTCTDGNNCTEGNCHCEGCPGNSDCKCGNDDCKCEGGCECEEGCNCEKCNPGTEPEPEPSCECEGCPKGEDCKCNSNCTGGNCECEGCKEPEDNRYVIPVGEYTWKTAGSSGYLITGTGNDAVKLKYQSNSWGVAIGQSNNQYTTISDDTVKNGNVIQDALKSLNTEDFDTSTTVYFDGNKFQVIVNVAETNGAALDDRKNEEFDDEYIEDIELDEVGAEPKD